MYIHEKHHEACFVNAYINVYLPSLDFAMHQMNDKHNQLTKQVIRVI